MKKNKISWPVRILILTGIVIIIYCICRRGDIAQAISDGLQQPPT